MSTYYDNECNIWFNKNGKGYLHVYSDNIDGYDEYKRGKVIRFRPEYFIMASKYKQSYLFYLFPMFIYLIIIYLFDIIYHVYLFIYWTGTKPLLSVWQTES